MSVSVIRSSSSQQDIIVMNPMKENERQGEMKRTNCNGKEGYHNDNDDDDDNDGDRDRDEEKPAAVMEEQTQNNNNNNIMTGNCIGTTSSSSSSCSRPRVSLTLQLDKKDDHKLLQKWSSKNLGNMVSPNGTYWKTPNVQVLSISIKCSGRPELEIPEPFISSPKAILFSLKEASKYRFKFSFIVSNKDVVGLKYINTIWKTGVRVDKTEAILGTFKPREEPYEYELDEDTTPSGIFVRGLYCAKIKVVDNQGICYMDIKYYFELQKN